jgi:hypothetical protein
METNNRELNGAILACMHEIGSVSKDKRNGQQQYDYVSETAVLAAAQPAMVKNGLVMSLAEIEHPFRESKDTKTGGKLTLTGGVYVFKVEHAATGQFKLIKSMGEGMDSGDKASYKAQTGARKNAIFDMFLIPRTDDPEKDEAPNMTSEELQEARKAPSPSPTRPKAVLTDKTPTQGNQTAKTTYGRKGYISEKQGKRLWAISKQAGVSEEGLRTYLKKTFNIEHSPDIKWQDYEAICKAVESGMLANHGDEVSEPAGREDAENLQGHLAEDDIPW